MADVEDHLPHLPRHVRELARATLTSEGQTSRQLRQAIEARAASSAGAARSQSKVPDELKSYVDKVAKHAFKVTDRDIEMLKAGGYSEDEIFEITLSAALGASLGRLERGLRALHSSTDNDPSTGSRSSRRSGSGKREE